MSAVLGNALQGKYYPSLTFRKVENEGSGALTKKIKENWITSPGFEPLKHCDAHDRYIC